MRARRKLLALAAICAMAAPSVAHADDSDGYRYTQLGYAWHNVSTLTMCAYAGKPQGADHAVPARFIPHIKAAAKIWTDSPGPVTVSFVGNCTTSAPSDIMVVAQTQVGETKADGQQHKVFSGTGVCESQYDSRKVVHTDYVCVDNKGKIVLNDWYLTNTDGRSLYFYYVAVHELGHVLGLHHPMTRNCNGENYKCVGPVMSYGTCPYANGSKCMGYVPNEDDRAGIRRTYYGTSAASASGCSEVLLDALGTDPVELIERVPEPVVQIGSSADPDALVNAVIGNVVTPDIELLDVPIPTGWGPELTPTFAPPILSIETVTEQLDMLQLILAEPLVNAFASVQATAGKGWKTVELVMDAAGVQDPTENCL